MDHPEICGKNRFNDARTQTKDSINRQTQLRNTCDVTHLIPNWTFVIKITTEIEEMSCFSRFQAWGKELAYKSAMNVYTKFPLTHLACFPHYEKIVTNL